MKFPKVYQSSRIDGASIFTDFKRIRILESLTVLISKNDRERILYKFVKTKNLSLEIFRPENFAILHASFHISFILCKFHHAVMKNFSGQTTIDSFLIIKFKPKL